MRRMRVLIAMLAVGALALGAGVALTSAAAPRPVVRRVRGEVTAVEPAANPPALVVKVMRGKKEPLTVGVDVTDKTIIRQGKAKKTLEDIKVGDRVWMKYKRTNDKLVADAIHILGPYHQAAKR